MLWGGNRAIRVTENVTTWKAAVQEVTYQYNCTPHQSTGFSPNLLHHGYDEASPGLLHFEGVPANPPPVTQAEGRQVLLDAHHPDPSQLMGMGLQPTS